MNQGPQLTPLGGAADGLELRSRIERRVKPRRTRVHAYGGLAIALVAAIATVSPGSGVPSFTIDWQTIAAGGGRIAAGEYVLDATIGQGVVSVGTSCEFTLVGGFWSVMVIDFGSAVDEDINGDDSVDGADLGLLLNAWGSCDGCPADLNCDGIVDGADLGLVLNAWTG